MRHLAWLALALLLPTLAAAHESRPGYLEITGQADNTSRFEVLWKVPRRGELVMPLSARLPANCQDLMPAAESASASGYIVRRLVDCGSDGLAGQRIEIDGLATTITDVLVRVTLGTGETQTVILKPNDTGFTVATGQSGWQVFTAYTVLGVEHMVR